MNANNTTVASKSVRSNDAKGRSNKQFDNIRRKHIETGKNQYINIRENKITRDEEKTPE